MKKLTVLTYAASASLAALLMTACSKKEEDGELKVAEPTVQEIQVVCDEPSLHNRLVDALQVGLLDGALSAVQGYEDGTRLGLEQQVRQQLSRVGVELHNVTTSGATCSADVSVTLSAEEVTHANRYFARNGLPALDEQAAEAGLALVGGNRLVAKGFSYTIEDNKAIIGADNAIVNLVANTLASSAYSMTSETHRQARTAPTVRLEPVAPLATLRVAEETTSQPSYTQSAPQERVQPQAQPQPQPKPQAQPQSQAQPQAPAQKAPEHKPVADEQVELTIVESDDTY